MKKFLIVAAAVFLANISDAAYLYWQVASNELSGKNDSVTGEPLTDVKFNYASIVAVDGAGNETVLKIASPIDGISTDGTKMSLSVDGPYAINLGQLGDASAYSFYIEMLNYNTTSYDFAAKSEAVAYSTLVAGKFIDVGDTFQIPQADVWHGSSYTVTPEPTSAMLVMLGVGLLVLKRKKA